MITILFSAADDPSVFTITEKAPSRGLPLVERAYFTFALTVSRCEIGTPAQLS